MSKNHSATASNASSHHIPRDHIQILPEKIGVLIANLGTPEQTDYWSVRRYLSEFLSDKRVVDYSAWFWQPLLQLVILSKRPFSSGKAYRSIWNEDANESPLMTITKAQTRALKHDLEAQFGDKIRVNFCMRYGQPSTRAGLDKLIKQGCRRILFLPLYPQYAGATVASACDQLFRRLMEVKWQPTIRVIPPYFAHPAYVKALAHSVTESYEKLQNRPDLLICSYHGLPKRFLLEGDPYHCQCHKTTRLLKEYLGWADDEIVTTFQSRFGPEEWLKPYTVEEIARLAHEEGKKNIAIMAPAFSSDCIETLEEIQEEIRESFEEAGGQHFTYIPCLNDSSNHIKALSEIIREEAQGWL